MFKKIITSVEHVKNVETLPRVQFRDIIAGWVKFRSHYPYVKLGAFLNGQDVGLTSQELSLIENSTDADELRKLDKSIRITNVQLLIPGLKRLCDDFYNAHHLALTINFYFTPNNYSQCFNFHSDAQFIHIYQLFGDKEWTLLQDDQCNYVAEKTDNLKALTAFKRGNLQCVEKKFVLTPGDLFCFPYSVIHKAVNHGDTPTGHLTFSHNCPTFGDFTKFLAKKIFAADLSSDQYRPINLQESKQAITNAENDSSMLMQEFQIHYRAQETLKQTAGKAYV